MAEKTTAVVTTEDNITTETYTVKKNFWDTYSKPIIYVGSALILLLGAYFGYQKLVKEPNEQDAAALIFPAESLPFDLLRLSTIVNYLLKAFEITLTSLKEIIDAETLLHRGAETLNLSPYGIIMQSIINQKPALVEKVFKTGYRLKTKGILLPSEISLNKIHIEDDTMLVRL